VEPGTASRLEGAQNFFIIDFVTKICDRHAQSFGGGCSCSPLLWLNDLRAAHAPRAALKAF